MTFPAAFPSSRLLLQITHGPFGIAARRSRLVDLVAIERALTEIKGAQNQHDCGQATDRPAVCRGSRVDYHVEVSTSKWHFTPRTRNGLQEILDRWRSGGRADDADQGETALAAFVDFPDADRKTKYEQVLKNLDGDRKISQSKREQLLEQLLTVDPHHRDVVITKVVEFSHSHQCSGRIQRTAQRASLGHVETRNKLVRTLQSAGRESATSFATGRKRRAGPTVAEILRLDLAAQTDRLRGISLSRRAMWSFYQARSPDDPFRGVSKSAAELVRRLGLGLTDSTKEELVLWGHRLKPHQTAHVPTAFDAADYEFFRPTGKTEPLSGADGLREVVHRPITGQQLSHPIERAT